MWLYVLNSSCDVRYEIRNVKFVIASRWVHDGSCLICVVSVCLHVVVSNAYCIVCLVFLSSSCVPYAAGVSVLSISDCSFCVL